MAKHKEVSDNIMQLHEVRCNFREKLYNAIDYLQTNVNSGKWAMLDKDCQLETL